MDEHSPEAPIPTLASVLPRIPDPRHPRRRRYPWVALLVIVAGLLIGANSQEGLARWSRDVVFAEEVATTRTTHVPQALAVPRNLALSLLRRWRGRDVTAARQDNAGHPAALARRLTRFPRRL